MKKKFRNLDKSWKEILYALSGFGPNLLMVLMGAYFSDAVNPAALSQSASDTWVYQTISGVCLVTPALFSVLLFIGKVFDGIIDIPFAHITDSLKTKWGRRRPPIAICFLPMVISYLLCWIPLFSNPATDGQLLGNSFWFFGWALVFYATYTMNLIAFYGSLSTVCADEKQRLRVSGYKSFFDTISYVLVYALVPLILGGGMQVDTLVFILSPLQVTMLIPLFMIKEGDKFEQKAIAEGYDITPLAEEEPVGILESLKMTFTNKAFLKWCVVNCCAFFGLQMFLTSMNALIVGGMGLSSGQMAILNTCAFAPVPLMLYLFNKLKAKIGMRPAYQTCLLSFAVCIFSFFFGSTFIMGDNTTVKIIIGSIGGVIGSWAIGSFFMIPYMIPASISSVEEKLINKNHSAMFFAGQAVTTSVVGSVASNLVYENIKNLFIAKGASGIVYAVDTDTVKAIDAAAAQFGVDAANVFNFGTLIVPFVVSVFCIVGFIFAFKMPKNYSPKEVATDLNLLKEYEANKDKFDEEVEYPFEDESSLANTALWVLTGGLFGFFWHHFTRKAVNTFAKNKISLVDFIISIVFFPYGAWMAYKMNKEVNAKCQEMGIEVKDNSIVIIIFEVLFLNFVSMIIIQEKLNKIAKIQNKEIFDKAYKATKTA